MSTPSEETAAADPLEVWIVAAGPAEPEVIDAAGRPVAHAALASQENDGSWRLGPVLVAPATITATADAGTDPTVEAAVRVAALDEEIQALEAILADRKRRRGEAEEVMLTRFEASGLERLTVNGRTVFMQGKTFARANPDAGGTEALADALAADEATADLVKASVNANTLSSWVRHHEVELGGGRPLTAEELRDLLPAHLRELIVVNKVFRVSTRKTS